MSSRLSFLGALLLSFGNSVFAPAAVAKDYFLTIGGGYDATGNQISLEKNILFQQSILAAQRPDNPPYEVFFADGNNPHPDVQCRDPKFEETCPVARRLLAEVLGDVDEMDLIYRTNEIPNLQGPSNLKAVRDRFRQVAGEVKAGDRVIIYVTGHGGRAKGTERRGRRASTPPSNPYNTSFYFWNTEAVTAAEFTQWLDRFPRDAEVVLVMVQCYAGGFSHTIFNLADAGKGLSDHARCGFFAQVHDRGAAGCTPDANEADYQEYSSYFWGALAGKSRVGQALESADYDKSGQVSFAEAHAYAMIESDTIDVPVRTSGALLRKFSQIGKPANKSNADKSPPDAGVDAAFADMKGPISALAAAVHADRRAILEKLPARLALGLRPTVEDVQKRLRDVKQKISGANEKLASATRARQNALKNVRTNVYKHWPELRHQYTPLAIELVTTRADEFSQHIQSLPDYKLLCESKQKEETLSKSHLQLEREKACCERLLETCEDAVLAANLPRVASEEIVSRYEQLLAIEEGTLRGPSSGPRPQNRTTASAEKK
jgi:hypothetical protein